MRSGFRLSYGVFPTASDGVTFLECSQFLNYTSVFIELEGEFLDNVHKNSVAQARIAVKHSKELYSVDFDDTALHCRDRRGFAGITGKETYLAEQGDWIHCRDNSAFVIEDSELSLEKNIH